MELHEDGVKRDAPGTKTAVQQSASVQLSTSKKFQALPSSICDLDAITIAELCAHKRHFGRVLYGHFRIKPLISALVDDITTILVDANEDTIRLITSKRLWPVVPVEDIGKRFSLGKRVAIKEPLMNMSSDGMYAVRVIDPAELIFLEDVNASDHACQESSDTPSLEQLRKRARTLIIDEIIDVGESSDGTSVEELRNIRLEGNRLFAQENWLAALDLYSQCINLTLLSLEKNGSAKTKSEEDLRRILMLAYSARAEARLRLQQYEDALRDADEALGIEPKHVKTLVRKGKAAHGLGVFEKSCRAFEAALDELPHDQSIAKNLTMSLTALKQSLTGEYNLVDYYLHIGGDPPCPSCADFVGSVEIREGDGTRGRGLFATRRLQAGDDIVVSNPLAVVHNPAVSPESFELFKEQLLNKITTSKRQKAQLCSLARLGEREMEIPSMELFRPGSEWLPSDTEKLEVDSELILNISLCNMLFYKFHPRCEGIDGDSPSRSFFGIWGLPSFVNHSCAPNCRRSVVGEVIFLRACRDILEGEELTISYIAPNVGKDIGTRQAETRLKWLFKCSCERCLVEGTFKAELSLKQSKRGPLNVLFLASQEPTPSRLESTAEILSKIRDVSSIEEVLRPCSSKLGPKEQSWIRATFMDNYFANLEFLQTVVQGASESKIELLSLMLDSMTSVCEVEHSTAKLAHRLLDQVEQLHSKNSPKYRQTKDRVLGVYKAYFGKLPDRVLHEQIDKDPILHWDSPRDACCS